MESKEKRISSLNDLYKEYLESGQDKAMGEQLRTQAALLQQQGFIFKRVDRDPSPGEAASLKGSGRQAQEELFNIHQLKTTAISNGEFERAADLRDLENRIRGSLWERIRMRALKPIFVLSEKPNEIIVYGIWPIQ